MAKVAVDIDSTLYDFGVLALDMLTKVAIERGDKELQKGVYHSWNEWRAPSDVINDELWLEIIGLCHQDNVILDQTPFNHSVDVLRRIFNAGHDIVYISNRAKKTYKATYEWLVKHGFPQAKSLVCTEENKLPLIVNCQYLIDDRPKTLVQFVYDNNWHGKMLDERKGFGLFYEYNRSLTDVPGVYLAPNWALLEKYIEEKSDLLNG
jgi:5'(3')-deoxyribonucleotidase